MLASEKGYTPVVDLLLQHGAQVDLRNSVSWCTSEPLFYYFDDEFACMLLEQ